MKNQCQGCQAGWPAIELNLGSKGSKPIVLHIVDSGYEGERVVCTKAKYATKHE